jgi:hypothetical protein
MPRPLPTVFLLEDALRLLVNDDAVANARRILGVLDGIERQMTCMVTSVMAASVGNTQLHPLSSQGKLGTDSMDDEYRRWAYRLADLLCVPVYPYSARFQEHGPGRMIPLRRG